MSPVVQRLRSPFLTSLLVSILVAGGIVGLRQLGYLESLELAAYDWYIRLRPKMTVSTSRIALIGITESDIRRQGRWPLSDATLAQALTQLMQYRPRAIGLDLYRDVNVPPGHDQLNDVLNEHRTIVASMKVGEEHNDGVPPPPGLQQTAQVGFNDVLPDPGGVVRRGLLFLDDGDTVAYSLALRLALLYLQAEGILPQPDPANPQDLKLGRSTIKRFAANDGAYVNTDAEGYQFLLDFRDARDAFTRFSLTDLLSGRIQPQALADKIVLLGTTAESVKDYFYTPHSRSLHIDQQMSGIALHAHIAGQLLRTALAGNASVVTVDDGYEWGWILVWSMLGGIMGLIARSSWRFSLIAASGLCLLVLLTYAAFVHGWWLPVIPPAIAWITSASVVTAYLSNQEKKQRALLMQLFSLHVSRDIAETIWQQRDQFIERGRPRTQRMTVTVLFTDLVGFTPVSEKLEPQDLIDWLNEYMDAMTPFVTDHGGVILKFIGDAIMAVFGIPFARTTEAQIQQDAVQAVRCALDMGEKLSQLNRHWHAQQAPMIGMRIGIYTGPVVTGSVGGTERLEYNVYGDTVNTAARLESFDKQDFVPDFLHHPCRTLIGESTLRCLGNQFKTQQIGAVKLKGKEHKVSVYRVISQNDDADGSVQKEMDR